MIGAVDGVHDMGGTHGFGPVPMEGENEPVFHERWEGRVWAISAVTGRRTTTDRFRSLIEQMPPGAYLTSSYYERWLWAVERLAAEQGLLEGPTAGTAAEPAAPAPRPSPSTPPWQGHFRPGQPVRVADHVLSADLGESDLEGP